MNKRRKTNKESSGKGKAKVGDDDETEDEEVISSVVTVQPGSVIVNTNNNNSISDATRGTKRVRSDEDNGDSAQPSSKRGAESIPRTTNTGTIVVPVAPVSGGSNGIDTKRKSKK